MTKNEDGPDQARSWAIAMAGCVINSLLSGISRATGLFYVALIENYRISRMEANMPFTVRNIVRCLLNTYVTDFKTREFAVYGARDVTFIGGVFASLGISLCCFAPGIAWITVLWGGLHGVGVALGNTLFPVIINQYFLKYRATASGLALSGACVGSFILPVAVENMLQNYALQGTLLITGGFMLNVLPAALLMTPPSWIKGNPIIEKKSENEKENLKLKMVPPVQNTEKIREGVVEIFSINIQNIPSSGTIICQRKIDFNNPKKITRNVRASKRNGVNNPGFMDAKEDVSERKINEVNAKKLQDIHIRRVSVPESGVVLPNPLNSEIQETSLTKAFVLLIYNPMFYVISISLVGFSMLFDPAITIIVDYVIDKGLEEADAKYFIIMMSLGDLLGRLCFGWVIDMKYMTLAIFMMLLQVAQGICFILLPLFHEFYILIAIITIYGLGSGANLVVYPLLVSKYLASVQSLAIGSITVFTGISSFTVPLLIGYFRDNAGSYDGMFIVTGGISVLIGILWLCEPLLVTLQKSHCSASTTIIP